MDQLWIIILSLFAAFGIASLIVEIGRWLVLGSDGGIKKVTLEMKAGESNILLPFAVRHIADYCRGDTQIVVIDNGLTQEQVDALLLSIPDLQIQKER